jgi:hypothetical protein
MSSIKALSRKFFKKYPQEQIDNGIVNSLGFLAFITFIRSGIGILWMPHQTPIYIFLEFAPSLQLTYSTGFAIDAAISQDIISDELIVMHY